MLGKVDRADDWRLLIEKRGMSPVGQALYTFHNRSRISIRMMEVMTSRVSYERRFVMCV